MKLSIVSMMLAGVLSARAVEGANRFFFENQTLTAGATGVEIFLRADVDQSLFGFSFGVNYDETALTVTAVDIMGTVIQVGDPEFFDGRIDAGAGLVGYGCVLDFGEPFADAIQPGTNLALARLVTDVIGAAGTSSQIRLENVPTNPDPSRPVKNIMTNDQGLSIVPALVPGTITIQATESRAPQITSLASNSGQAGKQFTAVGLFFGEPGLTVEVCGQAAAFTLSGDQTTLTITAPACGTLVFAPLEVCNTHGCDTEAQGFNYEEEPTEGGRQQPNDENQDGRFDLSDPVSVLNHMFLGTNPTLPCGDGQLSHPANRALLNCNGDAQVDLSDAICMLAYLFLGGATPSTCPGGNCEVCATIVDCPDNAAVVCQ